MGYFNWTDVEWLNSIKDDIIERLESRKGQEYYLCDLGYELTNGENMDGSWYCSSYQAREDIKNHFDVFGSMFEVLKEELDIVYNPFDDTERFHCAAMIELYSLIFNYSVRDFEEWNDSITVDEAFIERVKGALKDVEVPELID